jgi:uncharacterized protein YycO
MPSVHPIITSGIIKKIFLALIALTIIIASFSLIRKGNSKNGSQATFKNGDIIFQTSLSEQSKAVQMATGSKYSHMGIIYLKNDEAYVFEAIQPVKLTPLTEWITRGEKGRYVIKRLKDAENLLTPAILQKMQDAGGKFQGKDYDIYFEWSDKRIYCSELVWKIYKAALNIEIGELQKLSEFDLSHPAVKQKLHERYGKAIPLTEPVISPVSMFNSGLLETVYEE